MSVIKTNDIKDTRKPQSILLGIIKVAFDMMTIIVMHVYACAMFNWVPTGTFPANEFKMNNLLAINSRSMCYCLIHSINNFAKTNWMRGKIYI